jgi:hypothetical protein
MGGRLPSLYELNQWLGANNWQRVVEEDMWVPVTRADVANGRDWA